jgi:phenylacetate-CoA ligase
VKRYPEIKKARVVVSRQGEKDEVSVLLEADDGSLSRTREDISAILKLSVAVEVVAPGSLPNDGKVIDDQRVYDS